MTAGVVSYMLLCWGEGVVFAWLVSLEIITDKQICEE